MRTTFASMMLVLLAFGGCGQAESGPSAPGTAQGKADDTTPPTSGPFIDAAALSGLAGAYARTNAADGELATLVLGPPAGVATGFASVSGSGKVNLQGCTGADCDLAIDYATMPRMPKDGRPALLVQGGYNETYAVVGLERDEAGNVIVLKLKSGSEQGGVLETSGPELVFDRTDGATPEWVTTIDSLAGLPGSYDAVDVAAEITALAVGQPGQLGCSAYIRDLAGGQMDEGDVQITLAETFPPQATLLFKAPDGASTKYVVVALMRNVAGDITRIKLQRSGGGADPFELVRTHPIADVDYEVPSIAGLPGTFRRVGPAPAGKLETIEFGPMNFGADGDYTVSINRPCATDEPKTGRYHATPENPMIGFAHILLQGPGGTMEAGYMIGAVTADATGQIDELVLGSFNADGSGGFDEWLVLRRTP